MKYGYLWWIIDENEGSYAAIGNSGNVIYINPRKELEQRFPAILNRQCLTELIFRNLSDRLITSSLSEFIGKLRKRKNKM